MKKHMILSGSLLLIAVLLLAPSIPAMEFKTMKDSIQSDSYTKLEEIRKNIEELKTLGQNFIRNLTFILMILIKGIVLPTLGFIITEYICRVVQDNISKQMAILIFFILDAINIGSTLYPTLNMLEEMTGSFLLASVIYFLLGFLDLILAYGIIKIIDTSTENTFSISGLRNSVKTMLNVS